MRKPFVVFLFILLIAAAFTPALSATQIKGGKQIVVAKDETIEGDYYAFGEVVTVEGTITGDLIVFCRSASINGTVQGDIIGFAQSIELRGTTDDDLRAFAENITVNGTVRKNATLFCKSLTLSQESSVEQDIIFGCAESTMKGNVLGTVYGGAGMINLSGLVEKNADLSGDKIFISLPAHIKGDLKITGNEITIDPKAQIDGKIEKGKPKVKPSKWTKPSFYVFKVVWLVAALLVGLLITKSTPTLTQKIVSEARSYWKTLGIGLIALLFTPVAIIVLAVTVVGLPLSLLSLAFYLSIFYVSSIFAGIIVGALILRSFQKPSQVSLTAMSIGLIILHILLVVPYLGFVVHLITLILGMGMIVSGGYKFIRETA